MAETPWYETVVMPALLRGARATYGGGMRRALEAAGFHDIPKNGLYLIGGLALAGGSAPLGEWVQALGLSKQGVGQLVDVLVERGYLDRVADPDDRRRFNLALTEQGRTAAKVQADARDGIDRELLAAVGEDNLKRTRHTLAILADIGRKERETDGGEG